MNLQFTLQRYALQLKNQPCTHSRAIFSSHFLENPIHSL